MPVKPFLSEVARLALAATAHHGVALGGGTALVLHGVVDRPTQDVDLFAIGGVAAAADLVRVALEAAGCSVVDLADGSDLGDLIDGLDDSMVRFLVRRGDQAAELSLSSLYWTSSPVVMEIGPVMALDDLIAWKVSALVNRREVRDYIDTAAFLTRHSGDALLTMARRVDPGIDDEDVGMVRQVLDRMPDRAFARYGLTPAEVTGLRERFVDWP